MTKLGKIHILIESFRKEVLGAPRWLKDKSVYEYTNQTIEIVAILKLVRAAQGLTALEVLRSAGLVVDMGASLRCVHDCVDEVYFLFEDYPDKKPSGHVDQFVKGFFGGTIDGYLDADSNRVQRNKIRSAHVRLLKSGHDDATQKLLERIYKALCTYTHADYVSIMEPYYGPHDSFNLSGIPTDEVRQAWHEHFDLACNAVLMAGAFAAQRLGKVAYFNAMMNEVR